MPEHSYLYRDGAGEFRWIRKSGNGKRVGAATEGYTEKRGAVSNYTDTQGEDAPLLEDLTDDEPSTGGG
jgi:hypothetical protein